MRQAADLQEQLKGELRRDLLARHGVMLYGQALAQALGYRSADSMRKAASRGQIPVALYRFPKRRGVYALTQEVADCLASGVRVSYQPKEVQEIS